MLCKPRNLLLSKISSSGMEKVRSPGFEERREAVITISTSPGPLKGLEVWTVTWPLYARTISTPSHGSQHVIQFRNPVLEFLESAPRTTLTCSIGWVPWDSETEICRWLQRMGGKRDVISGTTPVRMWQEQDRTKGETVLQCSCTRASANLTVSPWY